MRTIIFGTFLLLFFFLALTPFSHAAVVTPDTTRLVALEVEEISGAARAAGFEPIEGQVPLPKSYLNDPTKLRILRLNGSQYETIPAQFQVSATHSDASIALVRYYFRPATTMAPNTTQTYYLYFGNATLTPEPVPNPLDAADLGNEIRVTTSSGGQPVEIILDETKFSVAKSVKVGNNFIWPVNTTTRGFFFTDSSNVQANSLNAPTAMQWVWDGPYTKVMRVDGAIKYASGTTFLTYTAYLQFHAGTSRVDVKSMTFMNRGARTLSVNGAHKRFKEGYFASDVDLAGTRTITGDFYSKSNYTTQNIQIIQDATPGEIDWSVAPSLNGPNDNTPGNAYDNIYYKVRENGNLVTNNGGVSTANYNSNTPLIPIPNTQGRGLFSISNGTNRFTSIFKNFWQQSPKSITMENGNQYKLHLWPKQNTTNDFTHTQGMNHYYTSASSTGTYSFYQGGMTCTNTSNASCNLFVPSDAQNYVLEVATAHMYRFGFNFDTTLPVSLDDYAESIQAPLIGMPPAWYWGSQGQSGVPASNYLNFYIDARNWNNEPTFSANLRAAAIQSDKWGTSMWDWADVCTTASTSLVDCIPLPERWARGGRSYSHTGLFSYVWNVYGDHQWGQGAQRDADAYGLSEGALISALRNQDVRGIREIEFDTWVVNNTWYWQNPTDEPLDHGYFYQDGDWRFSSQTYGGSSRRHSGANGKILFAMLTGDWASADALGFATKHLVGGYPGWIQTGQTGSTVYNDEVGHRGKELQGLVELYLWKRDPTYLQTGRSLLLTIKSFLDACETRFGAPLPIETTFGGESNCQPAYSGTYGSASPFIWGYMIRGMVEWDEAWYKEYGSYDSTIHPWLIQRLTELNDLYLGAHTTDPNVGNVPKSILLYRKTTPPTATEAYNACATTNQGFGTSSFPGSHVGLITPLVGGTESAYAIECYLTNGGDILNVAYQVVGLAWLYHHTGNTDIKTDLERAIDTVRYVGGNPSNLSATAPSWRNSDLGTADIKSAAPYTHEMHQGMAALLLATSSSPSVSNISPASITIGSASGTITLTGNNLPASPQVQIGTTTFPVATASSTSVTFSLTAPQTTTLGLGAHQVRVVAGSTQTNAVVLTINPASTVANIQNLSPPIGSNFVQGSTVPLSATISNALPTETLSVIVEVQTPAQQSLTPIATTPLTAGPSGVPFTHSYVLSSTALTGLYNWRISVTNAAGTTSSNIFSFNATAPSPTAPTLTAIAPSVINRSMIQGTTSTAFTLTGTNFIPGTSVSVGNIIIPASAVTIDSSTQLSFSLTSEQLWALGSGSIPVNVQHAGGPSNSVALTITAPSIGPPIVNLLAPSNNAIVTPNSLITFSAVIINESATEPLDVTLLIQGPGQTAPIVFDNRSFYGSPAGQVYSFSFLIPGNAVIGTYSWAIGAANPDNNLSTLTPMQTLVLQQGTAPVVCGDNICASPETCSTCSADCGTCANPITPSTPSTGGGGGGGGGSSSGGSGSGNPFVPPSPEGNGGNSITTTNTPPQQSPTGNPATDFLAQIGGTVVSAITNDTATDLGGSIIVGAAVLLLFSAAIAYFFGLI